MADADVRPYVDALPRETAGEQEPGSTGGRVFTEGETYALVDDAVTRETAAAQERIAELEGGLSERDTALDLERQRADAAEQRATAAEQAMIDYRAEIERQVAAESRRVERLAQVAEVAPTLDLTDEARVARIVAMEQDSFTGWLADLGAVVAPGTATPNTGGIPRESAAFRGAAPVGKAVGSVKGFLGASRGVPVS